MYCPSQKRKNIYIWLEDHRKARNVGDEVDDMKNWTQRFLNLLLSWSKSSQNQQPYWQYRLVSCSV